VTLYAYLVSGALLLLGGWGMVRSRDLVHTVVCLSVAQSGTFVLLLAIGFQDDAPAPVFSPPAGPTNSVADPLVQALALTDIVVSGTVTALLLALAIQVAKQHGTVDPDELSALEG
jgi:multicomponent Na+:H+ antiporter subunit C